MRTHPPRWQDRNKKALFELVCPPGSRHAGELWFSRCDAADLYAAALLTAPLARAQVRISVHDHHFRVSPSVFNDDKDVERLLSALPRV